MKIKRQFGFYIRPRPPYDFALTLHKPAGWALFTPFEVFYRKNVLWTALHLEGELTGLKLTNRGSTGKPLILAEVFMKETPSAGQEKTIRETLAGKLNAGQDLEGFYRMARKDPVLKHAVKDLYGMHDTDAANLFAEATLAILLQMAPLKRSGQMWECVIRSYGEQAVFDGVKVFVWPAPEKLAEAGENELKKRCNLGYRARYLAGAAGMIARGGFPSLEELKKMPFPESRRKLLELPGIGDYSADIIGAYPGFPIDAWSAEVFAVLFWGAASAGKGRDLVSKVKKEGLERWGEYCWMAFLYVVHDLPGLSRKLGLDMRLQ